MVKKKASKKKATTKKPTKKKAVKSKAKKTTVDKTTKDPKTGKPVKPVKLAKITRKDELLSIENIPEQLLTELLKIITDVEIQLKIQVNYVIYIIQTIKKVNVFLVNL